MHDGIFPKLDNEHFIINIYEAVNQYYASCCKPMSGHCIAVTLEKSNLTITYRENGKAYVYDVPNYNFLTPESICKAFIAEKDAKITKPQANILNRFYRINPDKAIDMVDGINLVLGTVYLFHKGRLSKPEYREELYFYDVEKEVE